MNFFVATDHMHQKDAIFRAKMDEHYRNRSFLPKIPIPKRPEADRAARFFEFDSEFRLPVLEPWQTAYYAQREANPRMNIRQERSNWILEQMQRNNLAQRILLENERRTQKRKINSKGPGEFFCISNVDNSTGLLHRQLETKSNGQLFRIAIDVTNFRDREINVDTVDRRIVVTATKQGKRDRTLEIICPSPEAAELITINYPKYGQLIVEGPRWIQGLWTRVKRSNAN